MDGSQTSFEPRLRPADSVMRLSRLGVMQPTRLSFLRVLMRRLADAKAVVTRPVWDMNDEGHGCAV